jgi:hypothetical protein
MGREQYIINFFNCFKAPSILQQIPQVRCPMFANLLAAPFALLSLLMLYLAWQTDGENAIWIVPPLLITALIVVMAPQINWWWYRRNPPALPTNFLHLLEKTNVFYRQLSEVQRKTFRERVALFKMGTDWQPKGFPDDELPPDIPLALSVQAVMLTLGKPDFLFDRFEKVFIYPRPFPSPEYPMQHASEMYVPDGCLIFSAEQVMRGFIQPKQWYNVGLHEYAKAFVMTYPDAMWPAFSEIDWAALETASGMPRDHVISVIGLPEEVVEPLPVAIHHFFTFPEGFATSLPAVAAHFTTIFWGE